MNESICRHSFASLIPFWARRPEFHGVHFGLAGFHPLCFFCGRHQPEGARGFSWFCFLFHFLGGGRGRGFSAYGVAPFSHSWLLKSACCLITLLFCRFSNGRIPKNFRASGSVRRHWHLACLLLPLARVPLVCSSVLSGSPILPDTPSNVGGVLSATKRVLPKRAPNHASK